MKFVFELYKSCPQGTKISKYCQVGLVMITLNKVSQLFFCKGAGINKYLKLDYN